MVERKFNKRFGAVAIEKGFIIKEELIEAMIVQIESHLDEAEPKLVGSILNDMHHMTEQQIDEVVNSMSKKPYVCPSCGVMILECSNCGAILR